jgi:hypothetical protein
VRRDLGVDNHRTSSVPGRFEAYLPFLLTVQRRQEWERAQATARPPREGFRGAAGGGKRGWAAPRDPNAFYATRGFRAMALLPDGGLRCASLTIDAQVLHALHRRCCVGNVLSAGVEARIVADRAAVQARNRRMLADAKPAGAAAIKTARAWAAGALAADEAVATEALWSHYFALGALEHPGGEWRVARILETNGVGCSVRFARPLRDGEAQKTVDRDEGLFRFRAIPNLEVKRVVAVDPGRRDLFTALHVELAADNATVSTVDAGPIRDHCRVPKRDAGGPSGPVGAGLPRDRRRVAVSCSQGEYRELAGFSAAERRQRRSMRDHPTIAAFQAALPSLRTSDPAQSGAHLTALASVGGREAMALYGGVRARERQFERTRQAQQTLDRLCGRLIATAGPAPRGRPTSGVPYQRDGFREDVVIAWGDGSFGHASPGHGAGPNKALKRNLARYCAVLDTNEFRSSKLCSDCYAPLASKGAARLELNWSVRRCENADCCTRWWHRDVNAARNIGRAFFCAQRGIPLPTAFIRAGTPSEPATATGTPSADEPVSTA